MLAVGCTVALAGCGGSSRQSHDTPAPAQAPSGAAATVVQYHCHAGRRDAITVTLPDPRRLAEVLNPINVCEYDGGLEDVSLSVGCAMGAAPKQVRIVAVDGKLPTSAGSATCG